MRLIDIKKRCESEFRTCGIDRPEYEANLIIKKVLDIDAGLLVTKYDSEISQEAQENILLFAKMRLQKMPLSYILGEAEFYGRTFKVGTGCLVPRPETELLAEAMIALSEVSSGHHLRFADWCTGSGCIGISILLEVCRAAFAFGIDSSALALNWARTNAKLHGVSDRFVLLQEANPSECRIEDGSLDFIVTNPPYIPSREIETLMDDVRLYEPREALDGGTDGMYVFRKIMDVVPRFVKKGGYFGVETAGDAQMESMILAAPSSLVLKEKIYDYAKIARHVIWQVI